MKKLIPVIIAIALICVIISMNFGKQIYDKYSYGSDMADLNEYFQIFNSEEVPIILQDARIDEKARIFGDWVYVSQEVCEELFTTRFYYDFNENLLLYSNPTTTIKAELNSDYYVENGNQVSIGCPVVVTEDGTVYIALDYIKKYVNFSYELFLNPARIQVYTEWGTKNVAKLKSDTELRWRGGVKSEILTSVHEGDEVEILEEMDTWTKVKTKDAFIGYVENFRLSEAKSEEEIPVTTADKEEFTYLTRDHKINLTWHYMEAPQGGPELKTALASVKALNVVSPTCFWLTDNEGNFKDIGNKDYVKTAHKMGLEVWMMIQNFHSGLDIDLTEILSYTSKREKLIADLVSTVAEYGADGINIDFESVPSVCGPHYVQFIRELTIAAHEQNLVVSVDNFAPSEYTAHYNRTEQNKFVDYIIIMGYDEHYVGSAAGSVSSIPWMQEGIEKTVALVPANKVINAVPFYTRVWKTKDGQVSSSAMGMADAKDYLSRNKMTTGFDETTLQNYSERTSGGVLYQVWLEDYDSMKLRLNIMQSNGLAGIASWRLGYETPDIWDLISAYMAQ